MPGPPAGAALSAIGFSAAYTLAILAGRATRVEGSEVSLLWPAAAIAVLWGLYARSLPRRAEIANWALLAVLTWGINLTTGAALGLSIWFVVVNLALALVTTTVLSYGGRPVALREPADLGRLVVAVSAGTLVAATLAVTFFAVEGQDDLLETFALFAVRNGVTALAGIAVALRLKDIRWELPQPSGARILETVACVAVVVFVFARVFWFNPGLPTAFAIMLPAMWVSLRYSTTVSVLFLFAAGVFIVWTTLLDRGALEGVSAQEQALLAQGMVGNLTLVVLTLSLFRDSRNHLIAELRHLALHDPLTGLANRALLIQRLESHLEEPRQTQQAVGVIYLDLDGFKRVNDGWGHREGDLLLEEMARRIKSSVRVTDLVARIGGDEFVIVCPGLTGAEELREFAERVRTRVAEPYGAASDAPYDRITASIGCAMSDNKSTAKALLTAADRAMYEAKRTGRNRTAPIRGTASAS